MHFLVLVIKDLSSSQHLLHVNLLEFYKMI
jgi:hypothetical protein